MKKRQACLKKAAKIAAIVLGTVIGLVLLFHLLYPLTVPAKIPQAIPADMQEAIIKLNESSSSDADFLEKTYDFVDKRYNSPSYNYLREPGKLFAKDLDYIWSNPGYFPCDKQNYVLKVMLVKSGRFDEKDIKEIFTTCIKTPHSFLRVWLKDGSHLDIDMWGADHGYGLGRHAGGVC